MINPFLKARLLPAWNLHRRWQLALHSSVWLTLCAAAGWILLFQKPALSRAWTAPVWAIVTVFGLTILLIRFWVVRPDFRQLARRIEKKHPSLDGRLVTAVEMAPEKGESVFIREWLLQQTLQHGLDHDWKALVPAHRLDALQSVGLLAAGACVALFVMAPVRSVPPAAVYADEEPGVKLSDGVEVSPGDVALEKGSSLLVMVRFREVVPASVDLLIGATAASTRSQPLARSLSDPIFGGSVPDVQQDFAYRIEYGGTRSRDFKVTVFEYPALVRPDITLTYPEWTGLPPRRTEDTRRSSAVEGTLLSLDLQLNQPVVSALLKPREASLPTLVLSTDPQKATASLRDHRLAVSAVYDLELTDGNGRKNKLPASFTWDVQPNLPPVLKLAFPRGDQRPSALEELAFQGTVSDDFGVLAWGMGFSRGGAEEQVVSMGSQGEAGKDHPFEHLIRLEDWKVAPDDLVSWYVWAEDKGPDGKVRRTESDLYFGEIRPFDEIMRQGEAPAGGEPPPGEAGAGAGAEANKLAELQKQIINATWKLQRSGAPPPEDTALVRDSQKEALDQLAEAAAEGNNDPRIQAAWSTARTSMEKALQELELAARTPGSLTPALTQEQAAYQALLAVRAREINISRSQSSSASASASSEQRQQELDEMELTEEENRYQMTSEAQEEQDAAQREQRQVQNRLQELARRQEEVNERLKELQTALEAAREPEQKAELQRELKRLEEEQRQTLADVDELNQRMEKPGNREELAQQQKELEEARRNVQQSTEATAKGDVAEALSAGTRAQRQLEEIQEDLRRKNATGLSRELRDLRTSARDLATRQEKLTREVQQLAPPRQRQLSDPSPSAETQEKLAAQQRRAQDLSRKVTSLSDSAESAEPLVSRQLYDSLRQYAQEDAAAVKETQQKLLSDGQMTRQLMDQLNEIQQRTPDGSNTLEMTSNLIGEDLTEEAKAGATTASSNIQTFREGIERAAEKVLGDDTEALKRAEKELAQLTRDLEQEIAAATGNRVPGEDAGGPPGSTPPNPQEPANGSAPDDSSADSPRTASEGLPGEDDSPGRSPGAPGDETGDSGSNPPDSSAPGRSASSNDSNDSEAASPGSSAPPESSGGEGQGEPGTSPQPAGTAPGQAPGQDAEGASTPGETGTTPSGEPSPGSNPGSNPGGNSPGGESSSPGASPEGGNTPSPEGSPREGERQGQGRGSSQGSSTDSQGENSSPGGDQGGGSNRDGTNRTNRTTRVAGGRGGSAAPITGDGYAPWSDRLREVEEIVEFPDLREGISNARERMRQTRVELKRDLKKPDWAVVRAEVMTPLVEVRQRLREELSRRNSRESLVPIDRDPVPGRYSELVRRYYEQLGREP